MSHGKIDPISVLRKEKKNGVGKGNKIHCLSFFHSSEHVYFLSLTHHCHFFVFVGLALYVAWNGSLFYRSYGLPSIE